MSYTRFAFEREFTEGTSNLYSYYSTLDDGTEAIELWSHGEHIVIDREDFFELIMSVLRIAGVRLSPLETLRLAEELNVVNSLRDEEEILTKAIEEERAMMESIRRLNKIFDDIIRRRKERVKRLREEASK